MPKIYPIELRERVVNHVEAGHSHRCTARHFNVSVKFVNDMVKLKRKTGFLLPKQQGGMRGRGKLEPCRSWMIDCLSDNKDMTLAEIVFAIRQEFCIEVSPWGVCQFLHRLGWSHKKKRFMPKNKGG